MRQAFDALAAGLFSDFGLSPAAGRLVMWLADHTELTSRELENYLDLPQPRVNALLRELGDRGWVGYRVEKRLASGRPRHVYSLRKSLAEILVELKREAERAHAERLEILERLLSTERRRSPPPDAGKSVTA